MMIGGLKVLLNVDTLYQLMLFLHDGYQDIVSIMFALVIATKLSVAGGRRSGGVSVFLRFGVHVLHMLKWFGVLLKNGRRAKEFGVGLSICCYMGPIMNLSHERTIKL